MDFQPKALVVGLMLVAAVVWVASEVDPAPPAQAVSVEDSLLPNERLVATAGTPLAPLPPPALAELAPQPVPPAPPPRKVAPPPPRSPAVARAAPKPRAVRQVAATPQRRDAPDERLRARVVDALGRSPGISGVIGVESRESVVRLTGYTTTVGQADRAARAAASVPGVRRVQNDLRPRIGS